MKLKVNGENTTIEVLLLNGTVLNFPLGMWRRSGLVSGTGEVSSDIFSDINECVAALSQSSQAALDNLFVIMNYHLQGGIATDMSFLNMSLHHCIRQVLTIVSWEWVSNWCQSTGEFTSFGHYDIGENDKSVKVYTEQEAVDLVILSIQLRLLMPILGAYIKNLHTAEQYKPLNAIDLISPSISHVPAFQKLETFVNALCSDELKPGAETDDLSPIVIPRYVLGSILLKYMLIFDRHVKPMTNIPRHVYMGTHNIVHSINTGFIHH